MTSAASAMSAGSGSGAGRPATSAARTARPASRSASACTSCGSASVTAPVSAGSVSTRIAPSSADGSCSGRLTRSKNLDSGRNASLTVTSAAYGCSSSWSTGAGHPRREGAGRQQQHREPVDRRQRGAGQHVRRARADGGGARPGLQAVLLAGVGDGGVHHGLLVAGEDVGEARSLAGRRELVLQQRLADAGDVAVAEDAEAAGEQLLPLAVALGPLVRRGTGPRPGPTVQAGRVRRVIEHLQGGVGGRRPARPGVADPAVGRVVADQPGPLGARARP